MQVVKHRDAIANIVEPMERQGHTYSTHNNIHIILILLTLITNIQPLMYKARPLCQHECTSLKLYLQQLLQHIIQSFPNQSLTPKLHMATHHIPQFLDKYHTVGMFGEHASESIHHVVNQLHENYQHMPCKKQKHIRIKHILNKQHQLSHGARLGE